MVGPFNLKTPAVFVLKGHQVSTCHLLSVGRSLSLAVLMLPLSQQDQQQQQSSLSNSIHQNRKQQHFQEAIIDLGSGNRISRKLPKRFYNSEKHDFPHAHKYRNNLFLPGSSSQCLEEPGKELHSALGKYAQLCR